VRKALAALAVVFLLAHLFYLPPALEDIDSVNFALGVRDFDVARHQPHPPGYPVFIALGKGATALMNGLPVTSPASQALGLLGVIAGALLIPLLFGLFRRLADDDGVAWWAMAVTACSPLVWFTVLRPLSDTTGLAFAIASQWLVLSAWLDEGRGRGRTLIAGAVLCGLAAGVRVQTVMLTAPLLLAALIWPRAGLSLIDRAMAVGGAGLGVAVWALPLLAASGGLGGYLAALGTQAGEDFSGVVMLWTLPQARVAVDAVLNTFIWPWRDLGVGVAVVAVAAVGTVRLAWRRPSRLALLTLAFGPYAVFHLLFHETVTVRYALPIVPAVAFLFVYAAAGVGRNGAAVSAAALVIVSLVRTVPAVQAYGRDGSPAFRAFGSIAADGVSAPPVLAMHAAMRRVEEWGSTESAARGSTGLVVEPDARVLHAPHGHEWLALVELWRGAPDTRVRFLADPRRTDLALFDPQGRVRTATERWSLPQVPFVAGTRPGAADVYTMRPPGWMLDRGWALTAEVGGITAKDGAGPHLQPSVAWIRSRADAAGLIIGGRHLGSAGDPPAHLTIAGERGPIDSWDIAPGFFFRRIALPAGALDLASADSPPRGAGYVPLRVSSVAADGSGRRVAVALEQFDLQPEGTVMSGLVDGWHEPEYDPRTTQAWRWMSGQARVWLRPVGRDVMLTVTGESPLKYFDTAPNVRVTAAGTLLAQFTPRADFTERISIPAAALTASGGLVTVTSDQWFSPADRGESPDKRRLALRVYSIGVE
jgi:hypothetical protein